MSIHTPLHTTAWHCTERGQQQKCTQPDSSMVAIDLTPLSVDDTPPVVQRAELHLDSQTLDELFAPELWSALAPGLDGAEDAAPFEVAAGDGEKLRAALAADGFVAVERPPPWCVDVSRLARAAASLVAHGFPPGFLLAYEASWRLQAQLSTVISTATGGNVATGDAIAFRVEPGASGFGPHRDRQPDMLTVPEETPVPLLPRHHAVGDAYAAAAHEALHHGVRLRTVRLQACPLGADLERLAERGVDALAGLRVTLAVRRVAVRLARLRRAVAAAEARDREDRRGRAVAV